VREPHVGAREERDRPARPQRRPAGPSSRRATTAWRARIFSQSVIGRAGVSTTAGGAVVPSHAIRAVLYGEEPAALDDRTR
jgi:hypothetical protein